MSQIFRQVLMKLIHSKPCTYSDHQENWNPGLRTKPEELFQQFRVWKYEVKTFAWGSLKIWKNTMLLFFLGASFSAFTGFCGLKMAPSLSQATLTLVHCSSLNITARGWLWPWRGKPVIALWVYSTIKIGLKKLTVSTDWDLRELRNCAPFTRDSLCTFAYKRKLTDWQGMPRN